MRKVLSVVPYIGTWIETSTWKRIPFLFTVVPYIGTWIETNPDNETGYKYGRTLYRYVD